MFFKLRLGALIPRSVCRSVGRSVGRSVLQKYKKIYKTLQNITNQYKTLKNIEMKNFWPLTPSSMKTVKEALALCRSFLDGVVIFLFGPSDLILYLHVPVLKNINTLN